jgi:hypothetical protein
MYWFQNKVIWNKKKETPLRLLSTITSKLDYTSKYGFSLSSFSLWWSVVHSFISAESFICVGLPNNARGDNTINNEWLRPLWHPFLIDEGQGDGFALPRAPMEECGGGHCTPCIIFTNISSFWERGRHQVVFLFWERTWRSPPSSTFSSSSV